MTRAAVQLRHIDEVIAEIEATIVGEQDELLARAIRRQMRFHFRRSRIYFNPCLDPKVGLIPVPGFDGVTA